MTQTPYRLNPPGIYRDETAAFPGYNYGNVGTQSNRVSYDEQANQVLREKTTNSLYRQVAQRIGITNFSSWNDVQQVENYLARNGGQSGSGSGSSGQSGTSSSGTGSSGGSNWSGSNGSGGGSSTSGSGSTGSAGNASASYNQSLNTLRNQGQLGQSTAQDQIDRTASLQDQLDMLSMSNQAASQRMVEYMNMQAAQTAFGQAQMQQQMQFAQLQADRQFAASQAQAQMQMLAMQQQQSQMQAAAAEQARLAQNMARAYVPDVKQTAGFTPVGDLRSGMTRTSSKLSELSDLALLPGAATVSPRSTMSNALVIA